MCRTSITMDMSSYQFVNTLAQCYEANAQLQGGTAPPPQDYYSMQYPNCYSPATQVSTSTNPPPGSPLLSPGLRRAVQQHDGGHCPSHGRLGVPGLLLHLRPHPQAQVPAGLPGGRPRHPGPPHSSPHHRQCRVLQVRGQ